jgi:hypothetical protein
VNNAEIRKCLIDVRSNNTSVRELDFSYQIFTDDHLIVLCDALSNNHILYSLILNATKITDRGVVALTGILRKNQTLLKIELARNPGISDACIQAFIHEFKTRFYDNNWFCHLALNPHRNIVWLDEVNYLTPEMFIKNYYHLNRPVIVRNVLSDRVLSKWSPSYFYNMLGSEQVELTEHDATHQNTKHYFDRLQHAEVNFHEAVETIENIAPKDELKRQFYCQQIPLDGFPEIQKNIFLPKFAQKIQEKVQQYLWYGQKYTHTSLHYDSPANIFLQLHGEKNITCYAPSDSPYLCQKHPEPSTLFSRTHTSTIRQLDVLNNASQWLSYATPYQGKLSPGDAMFIPSGWWHEVRARGSSSISMNYWFDVPHQTIRELEDLIKSAGVDTLFPNREILMQCAKVLIELNCPNYIFHLQRTMLQMAVLFHDKAIVQLLLSFASTNPNQVCLTYPFSPLFLAIKFGYLDILECFLSHSLIDVNAVFEKVGYTPLTLAIECDNLSVTQCLMRAGADPNIPDFVGRTT